jgi:S-adenosylmethionine:tRNA ribosyltransferase-isomerase
MKLSDFKYNLPKTHIAKYPVSPRDKSKLMVVNRESGEIENKVFSDVVDYMEKGDVLVVNETRVFQASLFGKKEKQMRKLKSFYYVNLIQKNVSGMLLLIRQEK